MKLPLVIIGLLLNAACARADEIVEVNASVIDTSPVEYGNTLDISMHLDLTTLRVLNYAVDFSGGPLQGAAFTLAAYFPSATDALFNFESDAAIPHFTGGFLIQLGEDDYTRAYCELGAMTCNFPAIGSYAPEILSDGPGGGYYPAREGSIVVTDPGDKVATPEPNTLVLMLSGIGIMLGMMMRKRIAQDHPQ